MPGCDELADAWVAKYGDDWRFDVADGAFRHGEGGQAWVFTVDADKALGFDRDGGGSQTRWTFSIAGLLIVAF